MEQQSLHASANKRIIEAVRSNPKVRGYCVHALTGGDWVLGAGLLDLWRNKKRSYDATKAANADQYLALRVMPRNIYSHQGGRVLVTGINDQESIEDGRLEVEIFNHRGSRVKRWNIDADLLHGYPLYFLRRSKLKNGLGDIRRWFVLDPQTIESFQKIVFSLMCLIRKI